MYRGGDRDGGNACHVDMMVGAGLHDDDVEHVQREAQGNGSHHQALDEELLSTLRVLKRRW